MEDDLLDVITVATTGNVCFIIAVIFDVCTIRYYYLWAREADAG